MMKKEFLKPELIVILFDVDDIITNSDPFWGGDDEEGLENDD